MFWQKRSFRCSGSSRIFSRAFIISRRQILCVDVNFFYYSRNICNQIEKFKSRTIYQNLPLFCTLRCELWLILKEKNGGLIGVFAMLVKTNLFFDGKDPPSHEFLFYFIARTKEKKKYEKRQCENNFTDWK